MHFGSPWNAASIENPSPPPKKRTQTHIYQGGGSNLNFKGYFGFKVYSNTIKMTKLPFYTVKAPAPQLSYIDAAVEKPSNLI